MCEYGTKVCKFPQYTIKRIRAQISAILHLSDSDNEGYLLEGET